METQSPNGQQAGVDLGAFDDILRDLDAWALAAGDGAAPRQEPPAGQHEANLIAAQACVVILEPGLYALRAAPAGGAGRTVAGTHIGIPPNRPRGAILVWPGEAKAGCWLDAAEEVAIVKVCGRAGRLLVTRYGAAPVPASDSLEILRLDRCE